MALNPAKLKSQIQNVFSKRSDDINQIASSIAREYYAYAVAAQAPPGSPVVLTGRESKGLENSLVNIMSKRLPGPLAAQAVCLAISQFWIAPPVTTLSGGLVTLALPTPGMNILLSVNAKDFSQSALYLSQSFDIITRSVFVTNPYPLPPGTLF